MITIDTITKKYGKTEVLNIASIEIPTGQALGWLEIMGQVKQRYSTFFWT